jgi:hypothetical protein
MLWGDGFEIETVINCRMAAAGVRITEVPSVERRRIHGESNLRTFADGSRVLRTIVAERRRYSQRNSTPQYIEAMPNGPTDHLDAIPPQRHPLTPQDFDTDGLEATA